MNDYKELIAELRKCKYSAPNTAKYAADAIEQLVRERDAAIADLHGYCWCCTKVKEHCSPTDDDDCENWEWRGVQEVADEET